MWIQVMKEPFEVVEYIYIFCNKPKLLGLCTCIIILTKIWLYSSFDENKWEKKVFIWVFIMNSSFLWVIGCEKILI